MEALAGEQEPAAGAGSGPNGSEEIDLSLDDIIKRNKRGQSQIKAARNRWRQQLKNRNPSYGNGRPRFRSWAPQGIHGTYKEVNKNGQGDFRAEGSHQTVSMHNQVSGAYRFRGGFRKQQYYRKQFWNSMPGPRRTTAMGPNGISPLNRPASAQQLGKQDETMVQGNSDGGAADPQQGQPKQVKQFRHTNAFPPAQRPFKLNRRPPFMQRQSRFNYSRGQRQSNLDRKQPWTSRRQLQPSSGAVLTVSVSNPQVSQMKTPGAKRPFLRRGNTPIKMTQPKPKGVPLRFNFRAMANQTSLTLNERFSGLRNKPRFTALRNMSRMVTLP